MPAERGTTAFADEVDRAVSVVTQYREAVEAAIADRIVTETELQRLVRLGQEIEAAVLPVVGRVSEIDAAMAVIGAIAGAGAVTEWAFKKAREAHRDTVRLRAA
mgnify:FL=1